VGSLLFGYSLGKSAWPPISQTAIIDGLWTSTAALAVIGFLARSIWLGLA
jgi:hypothetical protein